MVTGFSCHDSEEEARRRGLDGFQFFGFALGHHYIFGTHKPGRTNIWEMYESARGNMPDIGGRGIGTPDQLREHLRSFSDVGVDQVVFIQQGGKNRHEHICESLELFADRVMPEFKANEDERRKRKMEELAPYLDAAMARKQWMKPLADEEIEEFRAYGRNISEVPKQGGIPIATSS
jgi:hypothetical protein